MNILLAGNTLRQAHSFGLVTGYDVATCELTKAFFRYLEKHAISCLYEPKQFQEKMLTQFIREIEAEVGVLRNKLNLINEYDILFYGIDKLATIDVMHSVNADALTLLSLRENFKKPIPLTFTMHGLAEQDLFLNLYYPLVHFSFRAYDAIICTSNTVKKTIERVLSRIEARAVNSNNRLKLNDVKRIKLEVVPLGIDTRVFQPLNKANSREKYGINYEAFVILWFGRFSDCFKADLFPLLHVFSELIKTNKDRNLFLVLAGSQDELNDYAGKVKAEINRLGLTNYVKIIFNNEISNRAELYSMSDVFTSPIDNIQETFGLTPIEAMACGVPQIVSDWDGYRDTVIDGVTGFRIKTLWSNCMDDIATFDYLPTNPITRTIFHKYFASKSVVVDCGEYTKKLQTLIDRPDLRIAMSVASRERALKQYDIKTTVQNTENVWDKLTSIALQSKFDYCNKKVFPRIDYCNDFSAYPTRFLSDYEPFVITQFGKEKDMQDMPQYKLFHDVIEEAEIPQLLLNLFRNGESKTITELPLLFPKYSLCQIRRAIMLLYKYDLVQLCT
jgi:glycosyltransferase involved in cell wall biosynthesis